MDARTWVGVLAVGIMFACTSAVTTVVKAPPKPGGCTVQIFPNEAAVGRPHETVCLVNTALTTDGALSQDNLPDDSRHQACECGGDAIVLPPVADGGRGQSVVVTVIRYTGS